MCRVSVLRHNCSVSVGLPACSWDAILERQLAVIRANLALLDAFFARWQHIVEWRRPRVGTIAFPRLLTGENIEAWCEELVQQTGVLLLPGSVYHPQAAAEGRFRLGFGRRNLPECLRHLETFLAARYPGTTLAPVTMPPLACLGGSSAT